MAQTESAAGNEDADVLKGLPLSFVENRGQWSGEVDYAAKRGATRFWMAPGKTSVVLETGDPEAGTSRAARVDFVFEGAEEAAPVGEDRLPGVHNYLRGSDPSKWHTGVPIFNRVTYPELAAGISASYYEAADGSLEYDVYFDAVAEVGSFVVRCEGAESLSLDAEGALLVETGLGIIRQHIPAAWEEDPETGDRHEIACRYELLEGNRFRFHADGWQKNGRLVIDPVFSFAAFRSLQWSTFLGGSKEDRVYDVAVADFGSVSGQVFVVGTTDSPETSFHITAGSFQTLKSGFKDVFVTRLNATGSALIYSTYLGGKCDDEGRAIDLAIGPNPENQDALEPILATITGFTNTTSTCVPTYPTTLGAFDGTTKCNTLPPPFANQTDVIITQLNAQGTALNYSTLLGGDGPEEGLDIVVDRSVEPPNATVVFVTGWTGAINEGACGPIVTPFPVTSGAFDVTFNGSKDAFCTQMALVAAAGAELLSSTYLGGENDEEGRGIALHSSGEVVVAGLTLSAHTSFPVSAGSFQQTLNGAQDAFVFRFDTNANPLAFRKFATYIGGSDLEAANAVVVHEDAFGGRVTVAGTTTSTDFPTSPGAFQTAFAGGTNDGCVTRLSADGTTLVWSTYVGGDEDDIVWDLTSVPTKTSVDICGQTSSSNFPTTTGAYDTSHNGMIDAFVARVRNDGSALNCSTFFGGGRDDIARGISSDGVSDTVVGGWTSSGVTPPFPTTTGALQTVHAGPFLGLDGFVTEFRVGNIINPGQ